MISHQQIKKYCLSLRCMPNKRTKLKSVGSPNQCCPVLRFLLESLVSSICLLKSRWFQFYLIFSKWRLADFGSRSKFIDYLFSILTSLIFIKLVNFGFGLNSSIFFLFDFLYINIFNEQTSPRFLWYDIIRNKHLHVCDKQIKCPTSIRRWHFSREKNKNKGQEAKCATSIRKHL